jgi:hypothetical protein
VSSHLFKIIEDLSKEMREATLAASVPSTTFELVLEVTGDLTEDELRERAEFLQTVRRGEYQEVLDVWGLLPPHVWAQYDIMGVAGLREQRMLSEARKKLRKAWRKKYGEATKQGVDPSGSP